MKSLPIAYRSLAEYFITFKKSKTLQKTLSKVYGLNYNALRKPLRTFGLKGITHIKHIPINTFNLCINYIQKLFLIGQVLRVYKLNQKKHQILINSYKGYRYRMALPANGQRTHTNARTGKRLKRNAFL